MKNLLALLLLLPAAAFGQFNLQSSGTSQRLNGVDFYSNAEGWAVGNGGTVLHTTDSGVHWNPVQIGASGALNAVAYGYFANSGFYDPLAINIAGNGGKFYGTRDGINWYSATISGEPTLNAVEFPSIPVGYVAGNAGALYRSSDSGYTWNKVTIPGTANFYGMYWYDESTGWVLGASGAAYYTEDAGGHWYKQELNTTADLRAMSYGDDLTAWIVGNKVIIKTTDDAANFVTQVSPYDLRDVEALSGTTAFAVGAGGHIIGTTDGSNWLLGPSITTNDLTGIVSPESDDIFIVGDAGTIVSSIEQPHGAVKAIGSGPSRVAVYPNPVGSTLHIDRVAPGTLRIYNSLGVEITSLTVSDRSISVDMSAWPAGIYHLILTNGTTTATSAISVQH